jgi:hypothetical protein
MFCWLLSWVHSTSLDSEMFVRSTLFPCLSHTYQLPTLSYRPETPAAHLTGNMLSPSLSISTAMKILR